MKIEVERDELLAALRSVSDAVEARSTIPVLSNVLLEAESGKLALVGTNLDLQITGTVAAAGEMKITAPSAKLLAAVQSVSGGKLSLEVEKGALLLKQGRSRRTMPTLPAEDFPKWREFGDGPTDFQMPAKAMLRLLDACHTAMSTEETRYYLCGIFLHVAEDKLVAVGTDGHRLMKAAAALPDGAAGLKDVIVPRRAVGWLRSELAKRDEAVSVRITSRAIMVTIGERMIHAKLVDGQYPDYRRVMPAATGRYLTIKRSILDRVAAGIATVIDAEGEKLKQRKITFSLNSPGPHVAQGADIQGVSSSEEFEGDLTGAAIKFGVDATYLRGLLQQLPTESTVTLDLADPSSPIRIENDADADMVAVIMPMRV